MTNKNSLDLLRLVAAAMVLYSHQYALLGLAEPAFISWDTIGRAGVTIFFFLSGYLVWSSWDRDSAEEHTSDLLSDGCSSDL